MLRPLTRDHGTATAEWIPDLNRRLSRLRSDAVIVGCDGAVSWTRRAAYQRFSDSVVLVRKGDALTPAGILDRERRMGGWGAMAQEVGRQIGGRWTARSVRTLAATLRRSLS